MSKLVRFGAPKHSNKAGVRKTTEQVDVYDLYLLKWKIVGKLVTVYDEEDVLYRYCDLRMKPADITQSIGGIKCIEVNNLLIKDLQALNVRMISVNMKESGMVYVIGIETLMEHGIDVMRKANTFKSAPVKRFSSKRVELTEAFIQEQMSL